METFAYRSMEAQQNAHHWEFGDLLYIPIDEVFKIRMCQLVNNGQKLCAEKEGPAKAKGSEPEP